MNDNPLEISNDSLSFGGFNHQGVLNGRMGEVPGLMVCRMKLAQGRSFLDS
ncbi:MAG: hypothetical protein ACLGHI_06905 [Gammaproteobacteria bacterium]